MEKAYEQMKVVEEDAKKEAKKKAMVEQQAVDDATKITEVLVDPTISSALQEDGEQVVSHLESNATKTNEVVQTCQHEPTSKQIDTLNEASSMQKEVPIAVVVFSCKSNNVPINFVAPSSLLEDRVQAVLDLALIRQKEETQMLVTQAIEQQKEETRKELHAYTQQQRLGVSSTSNPFSLPLLLSSLISLKCYCRIYNKLNKTCWVFLSSHLLSSNNNQLQVYCLHLLKQHQH